MTLDDALDAYWAAAYAEGQRGATHDTEDGLAQTALSAVLSCVRIGIAAERERCSAEFMENGRAIGRAEEREACALACEAEHVGKDVRDPCDNASDEAYNQALEHAATAIRQRVTQAL